MYSLSKRIKSILPLLMAASAVTAQVQTQRSSTSVIPIDPNLITIRMLKIPVFHDTTTALAFSGVDSIGLIFKERETSKVWIRDTVLTGGHIWTLIGTGSGGTTDSSVYATRAYRQKGLESVQVINNAALATKISDSGLHAFVQPLPVGTSIQTGLSVAKRFVLIDTGAGNTAALVTRARQQQIADSTFNVLTPLLALKAPLASPALTGNPTAPTQSPGDNSTKIATTAFVTAAVLSSGADSGFALIYGTLSAGPIAKVIAAGKRYIIIDTNRIGGNPFAMVTQSGLQKVVDSIYATVVGTWYNDRTDPASDSTAYPDGSNNQALKGLKLTSTGSTVTITKTGDLHTNVYNLEAAGGGASPANPSGLIGMTAVNGTGAGYTRNDATHAIDPAIAPSWTGIHTFSASPVPNVNNSVDFGTGALAWKVIHAYSVASPDILALGSGAGKGININPGGTTTGGYTSTGQLMIGSVTNNAGWLQTGPNTTTNASFYFAPSAGVSITSPSDGQGWYDGTHLNFRHGSTTTDLLAGGGGGTTVVDRTWLAPLYQVYPYGQGLASSGNVTNYTAATIDSVPFPFTTSGDGIENGGWMVASTSGDSVLVSAPIGVCIGNSIIAGHSATAGKFGRLETNNSIFGAYPDSVGQISYYLDSLTRFHWYNQGIGGQTLLQIRQRIYRDGVGLFSNANDGRVAQTLSHKPVWAVLEGGINDIAAGRSDTVIQEDLEYIAAAYSQNFIPLTILTIVGDGANSLTVAQMKQVARLNHWLLSGYLQNKYGCNVVDIFNRWASGQLFGNPSSRYLSALNSPNFPSSLVSSDKIHFLAAGYDSIAVDIFNSGLPVLRKIVISSPVATTNPISNYNRINSLRLSNTASYVSFGNPWNGPTTYSGIATAASDTFAVTAPLGDSVWFSVQGTTNISGSSTNTILGSVQFFLDNNPTNAVFVKSPTAMSGPTPVQSLNRLILAPRDYPSQTPLIDVYYQDMTNHAFQLFAGGGNPLMILNGKATTSILNNAFLSIYAGAGNNGIGTDGGIVASGNGSQIASIGIGNSSAVASTTGFGFYQNGTGLAMKYGSSSNFTADGLLVDKFSTTTPSSASSNSTFGVYRTNTGIGAITGSSDTMGAFVATPTLNQTSSVGLPSLYAAFLFNPTVTTLSNTVGAATWFDKLNNYLNPTSGNTIIGAPPSGAVASSKFTVVSTTLGSIPAPIMTQAQFAAISSPASGLHAILSDSGNRLAAYTGSKIVTYATTDMLGTGSATSGTYTPTLTGSANVSSITLETASYIKVGNIVTVTVGGTIAPTAAATITTFTFTLPFTTATTTQLQVGHGAMSINAGTSIVPIMASIAGSSTLGTASSVPPTTTSDSFSVTIQYTL